MNFLADVKDLLPYILLAVGLEIFYSYTLRRHDAEMKKLKDEKAALLEILLAFLRHKTGIQHSKKAKSKSEESKD